MNSRLQHHLLHGSHLLRLLCQLRRKESLLCSNTFQNSILFFQLLHLQEIFGGKELVYFGKPKQIIGGEKGKNYEFWKHRKDAKSVWILFFPPPHNFNFSFFLFFFFSFFFPLTPYSSQIFHFFLYHLLPCLLLHFNSFNTIKYFLPRHGAGCITFFDKLLRAALVCCLRLGLDILRGLSFARTTFQQPLLLHCRSVSLIFISNFLILFSDPHPSPNIIQQ